MAPYLALIRADSPQRVHELREIFNGLRWIVRTGSPWRYLPNDLPPWEAVYQQAQRWLKAGVFEQMVDDLRSLLRIAQGKKAQPSAIVLDSRTLRGSIESGARAGYDGHKKKKGSKAHMAVDTLGYLLSLQVTLPASRRGRRSPRLLVRCRRSPAQASRSPLSIKAIREKSQRRTQRHMASNSRWSSIHRSNEASCSCQGAGWWNEASVGPPGSADSPETTSVCPRPWQVCTSSPSPLSCSADRSLC